MAAEFDREQLQAALDEIGVAAVEAGTRLDIAVYGGSALMLAAISDLVPRMSISRRLGHLGRRGFPRWLLHCASKRVVGVLVQ